MVNTSVVICFIFSFCNEFMMCVCVHTHRGWPKDVYILQEPNQKKKQEKYSDSKFIQAIVLYRLWERERERDMADDRGARSVTVIVLEKTATRVQTLNARTLEKGYEFNYSLSRHG